MTSKKNKKISLKKYALLVGILGGIFFGGGVFSASAAEDTEDIKDSIDKIEEKLQKEEKKKNALQTDLAQISGNLSATQASIARVARLLQETTTTIQSKEQEVANLEQQMVLDRYLLRQLLQEMYYSNRLPLVEVILSESDVQDVLQTGDNLFSTQEKVQILIAEMNEAKAKVAEEKSSLEETKEDHETLLSVQNKQKQGLVLEQAETKDDLAEQEATVAELEEKLQDLKGDLSVLTGKSYEAKDIRDAVAYASDETGVPKGVLYGFLKMETNLGANTGQCTYKEVEKVSIARYKKYGSKYKASINLLYKRQDLFYDLVDDLGYSKTKKVSCSPSGYIGQGGAMGVAQFMSDVWMSYSSQIASKTGHKNPDPWNLTDGVMAMALKLKKAGATSDSSAAIRKASINYLGGFNKGYYEGIVYWSKNYKNLFK